MNHTRRAVFGIASGVSRARGRASGTAHRPMATSPVATSRTSAAATLGGLDRGVKAMLTAGLATVGALAAHVAGGGASPGVAQTIIAVAIAALVALPLSGRAVSPARLAAVVAASQALFHLFFLVGEPSNAALIFTQAPGHEHHAVIALTGETPLLSSHALHLTPAMIAAHLIAAALTLVALHSGERLIERVAEAARGAWRGLRWIVAAVAAAERLDPPNGPARPRALQVWPAPAKLDALLRAWPGSRRGPPLLALV
ncbi:MAG: hypothetical protein ACTH31_03460 [Pseudoclavibacter sp.]